MAAPHYWELTVGATAAVTEGLSNLLWELGALGVVEEEGPTTPPRLRAFFPATAEPPALAARVGDYLDGLRALGFEAAAGPRLERLDDGDWAEAWRAHFRPTPVGRHLLVAPPWEAAAAPGRHLVIIEPGRAFGTGQHGSTAACLERLETVLADARPRHGLDVGTGSGILAIAAVRLGLHRVLAVDDDPDAVAAAAANAARNGVGDRVRCQRADAFTLAAAPAALVMANLLTAAHRRLAPCYAAWVAPDGVLLLGGILDAEAAAVAEALAAHGFAVAGATSREGWTALELGRPRGRGRPDDRAPVQRRA